MQETVETLLSRVHHQPITIGGCGRTDAGVHASQYFFHLRLAAAPPPNYLFFINKQLPKDIALLEIIPVSDRAQARYDAVRRTYDYFLHDYPDAYLARFSSRVDLTNFVPTTAVKALLSLPLYSDFRAFCKTPARHNTTIVHFETAQLFRNTTGSRYRFRFIANRFLRGMIRLLVNDLLLLGTGALTPSDFETMLRTGERAPHFRLAPPQGLFLTGVEYPYLKRAAELPIGGDAVSLLVD